MQPDGWTPNCLCVCSQTACNRMTLCQPWEWYPNTSSTLRWRMPTAKTTWPRDWLTHTMPEWDPASSSLTASPSRYLLWSRQLSVFFSLHVSVCLPAAFFLILSLLFTTSFTFSLSHRPHRSIRLTIPLYTMCERVYWSGCANRRRPRWLQQLQPDQSFPDSRRPIQLSQRTGRWVAQSAG